MNDQNHNDKDAMDQRTLNLINGSIDGEINPAEQAELDGLLVSSSSARKFYEELKAVTQTLDELPEVNPPPYLQAAIERQVRLAVPGKNGGQEPGLLGRWLSSNWLRTGLALAAGVVLTVGVYEMDSKPFTSGDAARMSGSMIKGGLVNSQGEVLDSFSLTSEKLNGLIELRSKENLFTLDVQLSSDVPSVVLINYAGRGMEFDGVTHMLGDTDAVSVEEGAIRFSSSGEQRFAVTLRRTAQTQNVAPLELDFYANNQLIQQAELVVSQ